jgi:hypothetical protein
MLGTVFSAFRRSRYFLKTASLISPPDRVMTVMSVV